MKNTNNINLKILSKLFIVIIFAFIGYFSFPSDAYAVFPTVESITESVFTTNTTVHDVSMPASVSTGDILLALTNHDGNGTLTTPTGWTLLFSTVYNNTLKVGAYYKISDGSEGGTTVNFQTQYQEALVAQVYRLSNAEAVVSGTALGSYTNQPNPPSLTSGWGAVDTLWVAYAGAGNGIRTVNSYPTNYTNGITTNTGSNNTAQTMIASAVRQNNIATENPLNFTFNITDYTVANTIAIKPAPPKPAVTTNAATSITQTTATINATANPNGLSSTGWFRYYTSNPGSCSDSGGTRSPSSSGTDLGSGSTGVDYNRSLTGLTPGTAYYVCAFASNANGTSSGSVASFSTSAGTPTAVTATGESNLGSYYATLNGSANPNGYATTAHFRFFSADPGSCTDEGGTRFPELEGNDFSLGSGSSPVTFSADVSEVNMAPNQTYWYCAFAQNSYGEIASTKDSFTALDGPTDPCDAPVSGNHTVIGACSYEGLVGGVDGGTGTSNTATFTVSTGSTLTIDPGQGVAWGGISLQSGSSINLSAGGALRRAPIWVVDGDVDGFPASNTQSIGTSQPEGGVRRNTLSENYTYLSKIENASLDCNDANSNIFQTIESLVVDLDNDGYKTGATASTECVGSSTTISGRIYYDSGNGPAGFQNFEHTKEIVLNESLITGSTNLTNFPVLVTYTDADLRTTGNGGDVTNANGYDIVFTTTSDVKLDHEIESYDPVTGEIVMWVKIPTLSYNTDTNIYIYYGDDAISTSQENVAGV